jgi:hypothetical protein
VKPGLWTFYTELMSLVALQDLLGAEMAETFAAKKALAEAELRNERLARSLGVEEVKNKRTQDSLKRLFLQAYGPTCCAMHIPSCQFMM